MREAEEFREGHFNRGVVVLHDGLLPDLNSASLVARVNVDFIGGGLEQSMERSCRNPINSSEVVLQLSDLCLASFPNGNTPPRPLMTYCICFDILSTPINVLEELPASETWGPIHGRTQIDTALLRLLNAGNVYKRLMLSRIMQDEGVICFPRTSLARDLAGPAFLLRPPLQNNANYFFCAAVFFLRSCFSTPDLVRHRTPDLQTSCC